VRAEEVCYRLSTMSDMTDEETIDACCPAPVEGVRPLLASPEADAELALITKALAHPMRVRILRILLERQACLCGEIVAELPISQATVSQHLKILKEAGLVQGEINGPRVCYCANPERLRRLAQLVGSIASVDVTSELEAVLA
jgi:ArsR family transcriptional regulator, arsenate/arsenite/antimonite-responsive transcriptional repressor